MAVYSAEKAVKAPSTNLFNFKVLDLSSYVVGNSSKTVLFGELSTNGGKVGFIRLFALHETILEVIVSKYQNFSMI